MAATGANRIATVRTFMQSPPLRFRCSLVYLLFITPTPLCESTASSKHESLSDRCFPDRSFRSPLVGTASSKHRTPSDHHFPNFQRVCAKWGGGCTFSVSVPRTLGPYIRKAYAPPVYQSMGRVFRCTLAGGPFPGLSTVHDWEVRVPDRDRVKELVILPCQCPPSVEMETVRAKLRAVFYIGCTGSS